MSAKAVLQNVLTQPWCSLCAGVRIHAAAGVCIDEKAISGTTFLLRYYYHLRCTGLAWLCRPQRIISQECLPIRPLAFDPGFKPSMQQLGCSDQSAIDMRIRVRINSKASVHAHVFGLP